jgi:hypothetical protein
MKHTGVVRLLVILLLALLMAPLVAEAQPAGKAYRIGILTFASPLDPVERERFLKALRGVGFLPGQNLSLEDRWFKLRPPSLSV